ncbi:transglutaminase [Persicimonas caeni]|uniref:Transglutaminase n=1 Tax=Persicimonas caeni TaxID=2292766 RepID=A0A4Y6Q0A8_PERCE|nr:transglutaminase domain-containing protein [Persicimonas caeni]QDG53435.1 transglutaminase [Persicimonas caeni]QED34656.1 transglutaminase [Persicimonas caeni]
MLQKLATALKVIGLILKGLWYVLVITTPLLGFWLASSLAAYLNGPVWAAWVVGIAAFPALPLLWELVGQHRYRKKVERLEADGEESRERILTLADRFVLRTLAVNLAFLGVLGALFPQDGFTALSTRGDWMLTGQTAPWADKTRDVLFTAAGGLEWLYNSTRDNPYEKWAEEDDEPVPAPVAGKVEQERSDEKKTDTAKAVETKADTKVADKTTDKTTDKTAGNKEAGDEPRTPDQKPSDGPPRWPMPDELHPAVATIPAAHETSPEAVARYIAANESDPYLRVKALYDWVADHIRYDAPALARGDYPPQDPKTVFSTRKAVCAGYAKLLAKMAETIDINMVYVTGVSRDRGGNVGGSGHAWNAVEVEGKWYLIDVTWGAGYVENDTFEKRYTTDYLFTPPEVLGVDHFPDDDKWQLRREPITRGEFMRQPILSAGFYQRGLELIDPDRSQITVEKRASLKVRRPQGQFLLASLYPKDGGERTRCKVEGNSTVAIDCDIDRPGSYEVRLFGNDSRHGSYDFVGQIAVNAR